MTPPSKKPYQVEQREVFERAHLLLAGSYITKKKYDLAQVGRGQGLRRKFLIEKISLEKLTIN